MPEHDLLSSHALGLQDVRLFESHTAHLAVRGDRAAHAGRGATGRGDDATLGWGECILLARDLTDHAGLDARPVDTLVELAQEELLEMLDAGLLDPFRMVDVEVKTRRAYDMDIEGLGDIAQRTRVTADIRARHLDKALDTSVARKADLGTHELRIAEHGIGILPHPGEVDREVLMAHGHAKVGCADRTANCLDHFHHFPYGPDARQFPIRAPGPVSHVIAQSLRGCETFPRCGKLFAMRRLPPGPQPTEG